MTPSEEFTKRYTRVEREQDVFGRTIGVRRLRPSEQLKVQGMTSDLEGEASFGAVGSETIIPRRMPAIMAASVCEIDGSPITFPKNRAELDAVLDMLDTEGMEAAIKAFTRIVPDGAGGIDAAKNSAGTPSFDNSSGLSETESRSMSPSPSTSTNSPLGV